MNLEEFISKYMTNGGDKGIKINTGGLSFPQVTQPQVTQPQATQLPFPGAGQATMMTPEQKAFFDMQTNNKLSNNNTNTASFATQSANALQSTIPEMFTTLSDGKTEAERAAESRRNAVLNIINANIQNAQGEFQQDARGAYVNKMQSGNALQNLLGRMNLNPSGFGVGQQMGVENQYGADLTGLQTQLAKDKQAYNLDKTNANLEFSAGMNDINSKYLSDLLGLQQYEKEQETDAQRYKDSQDQQKFENDLSTKEYNLNKTQVYNSINDSKEKNIISSNGGNLTWKAGGFDANNVSVQSDGKTTTYIDNVTGKKTTLKVNQNPFTGKINSDTTTNGVYDPTKTFGSGYQPNNIKGSPLSSYKHKGEKVFAYRDGAPLAVRKDEKNGKLWVWFGDENKYKEVTVGENGDISGKGW